MDLHLLHRPPSQFSNGERFTVRSASSPSYGLNRRHGIRKARAESQDESTEDCKEKTQIDIEEKLAVSRTYPRGTVSVTLQLEENDKSSHVKDSKISWTGPTDSTIKGLNTDLSFSSQSLRDRSEWKGFYASNRSKSLDFRRRSRSPDGLSGLPGEQSSLTAKDTNATRGGVVPSLETFHCSRASIFLPRSTTTQSLDMLSRGHSVPTRLKSPTQTGSVFRSNSLLGARGGQSILERIEKLYGSTNVGTMEDYSKSGDLSSSDSKGKSSSCQFDGLTSDPYTSPNRRSSEVTHGTFPRRLSTTERSSQRSMKTRNSLPVQMDSHRLSFDSSLWAKTTERAPEYQSHMFIKGDRITSGTQSLDRARSRNTISGQIRTSRFNRFVGPESDDASFRTPAEDDKLNINGNISEEKKTLKEQDKSRDIIQNLESRFSTTDDVFETDPQNSELKLVRRKALSAPAASVRNKINQFEAMTKKGSGPGLMQRRAFSVPTQHHASVDGVKKSGSARAIGGLKNKWEGVTEEREDDFKSVGEERKVDLEKEVKSFLDPEKDLVFYSRHKQGLDEMDSFKSTSEPTRQIQESGQTEETEQPTALASPGSDLERTPTNTPKLSPALSEDTPPARRPTSTNTHGSFTFPDSQDSPLLPLASASHSSTPRLLSQEAQKPSKPPSDLETWVSNWKSEIKVWNDTDDEDEDDEGTQKDGDSNYDSDSGESSITITSNISQSENRSFSVSLSDLYNFAGVDCDSETDSDEWKSIGRRSASLSSDMSALSYVSVLPAEELDRLIDDVKGLGENSLQEDVHVVVLHKEVGVGLGFSLAGGVDQNKPVTVHRVFHTGVAAQEGSVREGDQVLSINGTALSGCAHWEALRVLRRAKTREMGVVVLRKGGGAPKRGIQASTQGPAETSSTEPAQQVCVRLEKNSRDLGFSLEGGAGLENRPLTVQKIFQGGPVDKVYPGDELLEVEGSSMVGMRRLEAWTLIRRLPPGPVDLILSRAIEKQET